MLYHPHNPNTRPAVSVITPYYNTGRMFLETAESLLGQTLQQWEWLIINDGSNTAEALRVLLPFRSADARIRVIDTANQGPAAARNLGASLASAALLFFLDSDNLLEPTALEKLAWLLESRPELAFAGTWNRVFGAENLLSPRGFDSRSIFPYDNSVSSQAMLRRAAFLIAGGFDSARRQGMEDYEFWARSAEQGLWGSDIREYLIWDRRKPAQSYRDYRWEFRENPDAIAHMRAELRSRYPQLFRDGPPKSSDPTADRFPIVVDTLPFENLLQTQAKRRVLILMPAMSAGGAERFALNLAHGLQAAGDQVTFCLTSPGPHRWMDELCTITQDVFDLSAFLAPGHEPRFLRYLIASRSITHVLISHSLLAYDLLIFLRTYCPQTAFLDFIHAEQEQRHGGFARVAADHTSLLDLHILSSEHLRQLTIRLGAQPQRCEAAYIGVDTHSWRPQPELAARVRTQLGIPDDSALILFVGRLSDEKRPLLAAQIIEQLRQHTPHIMALMIGEGEAALPIRAFIRSHRLGTHLRMLGGQPHQRVRELMAAADILLLPSQREGIALTLYEALASAVVPVAADVGGQRELVTPDVGILVAPGPDELAQYVQALRLLVNDPTRRRTMAQAGRARVEAHFSHTSSLERMCTLFDRATQLSQRSPRPQPTKGVAHASATLAIEHHQLDRMLRRQLPVRLALRLRWSSAGRIVGRVRGLRSMLEQLDRRLYSMRRTAGSSMRGIRRRIQKRRLI